MNSIRHLLATASLTAVAVGVTVTTATAGPPDKGNVCHRDGSGWNVINIAEPAFDSHIEHGDAFPGEPVPGAESQVFDEDCVPQAVVVDTDGDGVPDDADQCPGFDDALDIDGLGVPDHCERLWAVVYDDSVTHNGNYELGPDFVFVKLIDNGDDVLGAGDVVYAGDYLLEMSGLTPAPNQNKLHTVSTVTTATANQISVHTAAGEIFEFTTSELQESYLEQSPSGWRTELRDSFEDRPTDLVFAQVGAPSDPICEFFAGGVLCPVLPPLGTILVNEATSQPGDQVFVNVDIYPGP